MKELEQEQTVIRQFLLGELDEERRQQVEHRVMTERDFKEEVLMCEQELLEDFLAGTLRDSDRKLFLTNYLSAPLQRRKLKIAQALNKYAAENPPLIAARKRESNFLQRLIEAIRNRRWFVQLSWGVVGLVLIAGTLLAFQAWRWRTQQAQLRAELAQLNDPQSTVFEASASVLAARLSPLKLRDLGGAAPLTITPETQTVQLRLAVPSGQYQSYRAVLKDSAVDEVFTFDGVPMRTLGGAKMLVLQIPARVFKSDDYTLSLSGLNSAGAFEETGDFSFRVLVRP